MIFLDVNTFFGDKGGGIRTYHLAKIDWFKEHPEHRYIVVGPGRRRKRESLAPNVERVWLKGPAATRDPDGYRLLLDLPGLISLIRRERPDVVEAGDPWFAGTLLLVARKLSLKIPLLSSFYHADPIRTYVTPWADKGGWWRRKLCAPVGPLFYALQRRYDVTLVSSRAMNSHLQERGVTTAYTPFGAPLSFLERASTKEKSGSKNLKLFYAGRLDSEKGVDLLLAAIPLILKDEGLELLVLGRGNRKAEFQKEEWLAHPRYRVVGYIQERDKLLDLLEQQDLLLSTCPWETFGLGVLECFALGIPAVAPQSGGAGELVEELDPRCLYSASLSGKYDNPDALIGAVRRTAEIGLPQLSLRAQEIARAYGSWEEAVGRMVAYYLAPEEKSC